MPVAMKLIELRNWIDELSRQHLAQSKSPSTDSYLMQLDLNLFPLTKKKYKAEISGSDRSQDEKA
ncbi:hypothetical protein Bb109J_c2609 [Bdellovibrio bacteriovorus]|nr:hypothetical protein EP01_10150 [Bdellovibrio bacteriovorus]BEV69189.1 hypothetical protein Bb109J_c2609 [Bdellovibrio bacteriovorus]